MAEQRKRSSQAPGSRRARVVDVARLAGVSAMTVSNVLNNPQRVSDETRRAVEEAIEMVGYTPNSAARALSSGRTRVLGFTIYTEHDQGDEQAALGGFLGGLLLGLVDVAASQQHSVLVVTPTAETNEISLYERLLGAHQVDAVVLCETTPEDPRVEFLTRNRFPFVAFGRTRPEYRQSWVDIDNHRSMQAVAEHVVASGRRRIAYLQTGNKPIPWVTQRRHGFNDALAAGGLTPATVVEVDTHDDVEAAIAAACNGSTPPDAWVADNDAYAFVAMRALRQHGQVPGRDVSVTGFNDFPLAGLLDTPLTTARVPLHEVAERLFARAMYEVQGGPDKPGDLIFAPLIVRASG